MRAPRRLVDFSAPRQVPDEVLAQLRAIDPVTELVYFGRGRWRLGRVVATAPRRAQGLALLWGERMMPVGRQSLDALRMGDLAVQGFGMVAEYEIQGEPDGRIVADYRMRDWNYHWNQRAVVAGHMAESCGDMKLAHNMALMEERIEQTSGDAWRWAANRPHSVVQG